MHVRQRMELTWAADADSTLRLRHFRTRELHGASPVVNRTPLLFNADVAVSFVRRSVPTSSSIAMHRMNWYLSPKGAGCWSRRWENFRSGRATT